jgi:hypothetical protein
MQKRGDKRGTAILQAGWIAVFIIGIFLVVFFMSFSARQQNLDDKLITAKMGYNLHSIFSNIRLTDNSEDIIHLPNVVSFKVDCNAGTFSLNDQTSPANSIIFARQLQSQDFLVMSRDWKKPFFAANFLYITSPDEHFYIIYTNDVFAAAQNFADALPEKSIKELVPFDALIPEAKDSVLIFFTKYDSNPQIISYLDSQKEASVALEFITEKNKVRFYEKKESWAQGAEIDSFDEETMLGAAYSADSQEYFCSLEKAMRGLKNAGEALKVKAVSLSKLRPDCADIYSQLNSLDTNSLLDKAHDLETMNRNLELRSCPLLY